MPSSTGPECPHCHKSAMSGVATSVVASTTKGGERITLVYCSRCHAVLGALPGS